MEPEAEAYEECRRLTNEELLRELETLSARERAGLVKVLVRLYELDRRELAQEIGYPSVFIYCVRKLRYSEATAFRRTKAAEVCHRFNFVLGLIERGELELTAVAMLAPHLTRENCRRLLKEAQGRTTRELERLAASLCQGKPSPERLTFVAVQRNVPATPLTAVAAQEAFQSSLALPDGEAAESPRPVGAIEVCSKRIVVCTEDVERMIQRAKEVLWHKYPEGRFEDILREALAALLDRADPCRRADRPSRSRATSATRSRHIPQWVRKEVDRRDGEQCAFRGKDGLRCPERAGLEYDHVTPWSRGGRSDDPGNIQKACAAHNRWRARQHFGIKVPPKSRCPG